MDSQGSRVAGFFFRQGLHCKVLSVSWCGKSVLGEKRRTLSMNMAVLLCCAGDVLRQERQVRDAVLH